MTASSDQSQSEPRSTHSADDIFREYIVRRDNDRPLSFAGVELATASMSELPMSTITATLYKTRGGKYISSLSKQSTLPFADSIMEIVDRDLAPANRMLGYSKAAVFDTFEEAIAWFRPGRLTSRLRELLGLDEPVRVD